MRILILGANGFIGHSLVREILDHTNWSVCGIDFSASRLESALERPRFSFHAADITEARALVAEEIRRSDVVLPLAAIANPMVYVREPLRVFEVVFEENLRIVRLCAQHGVRVVFPSTSEVYGMCGDETFREESSLSTFGPVAKERWIYATSKHLLERVIWAYGREGLRFTIFRPFNWFGPNLDDINACGNGSARSVTLFLGRMLRGEPVRLVDGGRQSRSFTYIDDGVDALMRIIANDGGAADGRIFNIGNPRNACSIAEMASRLAAVLSEFPGFAQIAERVRYESVAADDYFGPGYQDVQHRTPDIESIRAQLRWEPRVGLDEGLRRTVAWYVQSTPAGATTATRRLRREGEPAWLR